jgi:hypothetical protein
MLELAGHGNGWHLDLLYDVAIFFSCNLTLVCSGRFFLYYDVMRQESDDFLFPSEEFHVCD